ncbi:MAG: response regulator [Candidatus Pacebacteria bacterium]|nr:response regulator [Candidatus Paceibacterota bacterium]
MDTNKKILIIEDEEIISNLLVKKISQQGFEVKVACNGQEGLDLMKADKPDLVLTDIIMPQKDGFSVIEDMKKTESLKDVPVIIISNSGQPVELDRAKALGVCDWIIKTEFDPSEILNKIKKAL